MDLEKIKELVTMMTENDLTELEIADGDNRVLLKRGHGQQMPQVVAIPPVLAASALAPVVAPVPAVPDPGLKLTPIVSPIVGTFYSAPSPSADPFIDVGSTVEEDTVVCIIEAMKVMNEIKSEVKGVVRKVLVANGAAVEFGQPLFLVEPQ